MNTQNCPTPVRYRVGIDVGLRSIGFAAVEVDEHDQPLSILNTVVFRHDAGIDPGGNKTATTRLAASGVARRTRRRIKHRARQLVEFDSYLESLGWPIIDNGEVKDARAPWRTRARLVEERISDPDHLKEALSIALRHIARHRGWRSPYERVHALLHPYDPSDRLKALNARISERLFRELNPDLTPGQLVTEFLKVFETGKIRGPEGILGGTLEQKDYATEILKIGEKQGLDPELTRELIVRIFDAKSPKGSAIGKIGKDALPGQHGPRAEKSHPAFQRYRMVAIIANLRVAQGGTERPLTLEEREGILDFLLGVGQGDLPTWEEVADQLGLERHELRGTAKEGPDGMPPATRPPVDVTDRNIMLSKHKKLKAWWEAADEEHRVAMVNAMSNVGSSDAPTEADDDVDEFLSTFTDVELEDLDKVELPSGRAAYSVDSLTRLTAVMQRDGVDVHEARKREFGVDDSWTPPAEEIGARVGNPAVDRVLKQVARWLAAAEKRWGAPASINIEHVRDAFGSEKASREYQNEVLRRNRQNEKIFEEMRQKLGLSGRFHRSDVTRYLALQRQRCQCLYCGDVITFHTAEMDHIVSRQGLGSTNSRENLAAVCSACNHSKSNIPFIVWAQQTNRPVSLEDAVARVRGFTAEPGQKKKDAEKFQKKVIARLKSKHPDEEFDGRSLESVAWMALELRHRIFQHFKQQGDDVSVNVYRGALTAEGRRACGFEGRVNLIGGKGKTRLDRRHHVMDALTIAMMTPGIAQSLALRMNLRQSERLRGVEETWKSFTGDSAGAQASWDRWEKGMRILSDQFNTLLTADVVPVMQNLRLRHGSSEAHEAIMHPFPASSRYRVGDAIPAEVIDRASTPQLWTALTRLPDFDEKEGLPENPERKIRVKNQHLTADDEILFFPVAAGALAVRGGYVELGASFHHARLYRINGKKPFFAMIRVYHTDLLRFAKQDLFSVELPESCMSIRSAVPKLRQALKDGTAEYVGWIVPGDEIELDLSSFTTGAIGDFLEVYPGQKRWEIAGFYAPAKLRLRPTCIAAEGLPEDSTKSITDIVAGHGWLPSLDKVFAQAKARIIRRNALGIERQHSSSHLPISISPKE